MLEQSNLLVGDETDDLHDGGSRSDRIFCGFFYRDASGGRGRKGEPGTPPERTVPLQATRDARQRPPASVVRREVDALAA
jgi:hypothetical protein